MLTTRFGIEIEMTGLTRSKAAKVVQTVTGGRVEHTGTCYDTWTVIATDNRKWKLMSDASLKTQKKVEGYVTGASQLYSVELVSPILTYEADIKILQEIVRALRKNGAFANDSCGIHIHLDGKGHSVRSIKNFIHIIYARNDLFYSALQIKNARRGYCRQLDEWLVRDIKAKQPNTLKDIEDIWYSHSSQNRTQHYNNTRYHFLNLHSFFHGHKTVELRGFNSTLHAGEIRSYIVFALALNHQALTQKSATTKKPQVENPKFAMRTYLNRIGLIGDEFKACREHLTKHLEGSAAWRHNEAI